MIPFWWLTLDEEFDETPDQMELLEGIAHGHLNAAREFRHPQTSWINYRRTRYMQPCHYHTSFESVIPLDLIIHHIVEELNNLRPRGEFKYRSARRAEEEYLIAKMEVTTLYDTWLVLEAQLKALRESHVGT